MKKAIVSKPLAIPVIRSKVLGTVAICFVKTVSGSAVARWTSQTPATVIASNIECILAEIMAFDDRFARDRQNRRPVSARQRPRNPLRNRIRSLTRLQGKANDV